MNPAFRSAVILFLSLLSVFPCGAALTVLGTVVRVVLKGSDNGLFVSERLIANWIPIAWAGGGALGFVSLIYAVDRLILAQSRLSWPALVRIVIGLLAAGFFAMTYPLRGSSALLFRVICVAPVAIAVIFIVFHYYRFSKVARSA